MARLVNRETSFPSFCYFRYLRHSSASTRICVVGAVSSESFNRERITKYRVCLGFFNLVVFFFTKCSKLYVPIIPYSSFPRVLCPAASNWCYHYQIERPLIEVLKCHGDWPWLSRSPRENRGRLGHYLSRQKCVFASSSFRAWKGQAWNAPTVIIQHTQCSPIPSVRKAPSLHLRCSFYLPLAFFFFFFTYCPSILPMVLVFVCSMEDREKALPWNRSAFFCNFHCHVEFLILTGQTDCFRFLILFVYFI